MFGTVFTARDTYDVQNLQVRAVSFQNVIYCTNQTALLMLYRKIYINN